MSYFTLNMVAFPVIKLGALFLKQVSKPLANMAKARARQSPFFRNYVCMPPAQFYHWCEVKMKMKLMNFGKATGKVPKLNEHSAIELGADLMGETIIFGVGAAILTYEYMRQNRKENAKEEDRVAHLGQIQKDLKILYLEQAHQKAQILELIRILEEKIPDLNFTTAPVDESSIPAHHRGTTEPVEKGGVISTVKGWIFSAIDFVLPPINDPEDEQNAPPEVAVNYRDNSMHRPTTSTTISTK